MKVVILCGIIFLLSASMARNEVENGWDDIRIIIKKNTGLAYSKDGFDYSKVKTDLIEASMTVMFPEKAPAVWGRVRAYYLLWLTDQMELKEFVDRQEQQR